MVIGAPLDTLSNAEGYSKTGNIYLCPIRLDKNRSDVTECSELNLPDVGKIGKLTFVHFNLILKIAMAIFRQDWSPLEHEE